MKIEIWKLERFFLALSLSFTACTDRLASTGPSFYVAPPPLGDDGNPGTDAEPFATIQRAQQAVRSINQDMSDNINVFIHGGIYTLTDTLSFDQSDSGTNGFWVIYQAYPGESPHISGGQRIGGWAPVGNGMYKTNVGDLRFRQLYVNGSRAQRARSPTYDDSDWDEGARGFIVGANKIANWNNLNQVEVHVTRSWDIWAFRIKSFSISGNRALLFPMDPESAFFGWSTFVRAPNEPFFFENAFELLDSEGEWYLDTSANDLYYMPEAREDMSTAEVIAPAVERLVSIQGSLDSPARNLLFWGLTFEHSTFLDPNYIGFIGVQAGVYKDPDSVSLPAGVYLSGTESVQFERNTFQHMGATALGLDSGTHGNRILGNVFSDISGNGITVDLALAQSPDDPRSVPTGNVIRNNFITKVGRGFPSGIGIVAAYVSGTIIEHNEITDMPYSGINVGWGWTQSDTVLNNNKIRYNHIHNLVNQLEDGAGIYTLSKQPGTLISDNYIHDISRSPWTRFDAPIAGVYLDNGSSAITVANNVIVNTPLGLYLQYLGGEVAAGNTIVNLATDVTGNVSQNSFVNDGTFSPSDVIANAGIEPAYQDILSGSPAPPPSPSLGLTVVGIPAQGSFSVQASGVSGSVRVEFYVNGVHSRTENLAPYCLFADDGSNCYLGALPNDGAHTIEARAIDTSTNAVVGSAMVSITQGP